MDYTKQITETEADLLVDRVLETNRIIRYIDDLEKAIFMYVTPMLDREMARKFYNYSNYRWVLMGEVVSMIDSLSSICLVKLS